MIVIRTDKSRLHILESISGIFETFQLVCFSLRENFNQLYISEIFNFEHFEIQDFEISVVL